MHRWAATQSAAFLVVVVLGVMMRILKRLRAPREMQESRYFPEKPVSFFDFPESRQLALKLASLVGTRSEPA